MKCVSSIVALLAMASSATARDYEVHIKAETFRFAVGLHRTCSNPPLLSLVAPSVGEVKVPGTFTNAKYDWATMDFNIIGEFEETGDEPAIVAAVDLQLRCEGGFDINDISPENDQFHVSIKTNSPRLAGFMHASCAGTVKLLKHQNYAATGSYINDRYNFGEELYTHIGKYSPDLADVREGKDEPYQYSLLCKGGLPVYMIRELVKGAAKKEKEAVAQTKEEDNSKIDAEPEAPASPATTSASSTPAAATSAWKEDGRKTK